LRATTAELVEERVVLATRTLVLARPPSADDLLVEEAFEREELLPYWAELWPSGLELARVVAARCPQGRIVELGCGLGLPSIVAALAGADVLAVDWSEEALAATRRNARLNGARLETLRADWHEPSELLAPAPFDVVLAADVLYERRDVGPLLELLPLLAPEVLIADPARPAAASFFERTGECWRVETLLDAGRVTVRRLAA
jgi:predicted nicotinamide N-methyase